MQKQTRQVTYGCLLHDIGKLLYRAGGDSGTHSRQGWAFLRSLWPEEKEILRCVQMHHAAELRAAAPAEDDLSWIACAADNLSAAADRREAEEGEAGTFRRYMPLASVFTHLNGEHPDHSIAPYPQDGTLRMPEHHAAALSAEPYQAAAEALRRRLAELPREDAWVDSLLCLLESYTSMFPSSTCAGESPDISLYDHLKTTAAIGACISEYLLSSGERNYKKRLFLEEAAFRKENAFLLYSADISGIQKFLYTVASDKALRSLRSRSFFLELLMEHYADELLLACGVSRTNLLYSGGGHCYILLPNTESVKAELSAWNQRFNAWLSEEFGVSLFLAHGWTECSGNDLTNTPAEDAPYKAMFRRVSAAVSHHKMHRYSAGDLRRLNQPAPASGRECKVCGRADDLIDGRCPWCRLFAALSEKIQTKDVYFVGTDEDAEHDFALPTPDGYAYILLTDEKTARLRLDSGAAVRRIYSKNRAFTGLRYSTRLYVGDYAFSNRMDELAQNASGVRRLGVCRMDVDDLGRSFVSGYERPGRATAAETQHYVTISRTAAFSRQISLFFKCYINDVLSGKYGGKRPLAVTIVYSGGDDVFLVGAWNDTLEACLRIRAALRQFSCGSLTISGGLCVTDDSYPIRLAAERAGELEDRAKGEPGKDAIALFDPFLEHTYHWEEFSENVLGTKCALLTRFFCSDDAARGNSFLYRIVDLLRSAERDGKLALARYAYLLARLAPPVSSPAYRGYKEFSEKMYAWALDAAQRKQLITAIYIHVYENREGDTE